jgi:hypothetical protein
MTFGTWRWRGRQPHAPAASTPRKSSWYSFSLGAESIPGPRYGRKKYITERSSDTTGNRPGTVRLVAQRLNHYATPGHSLVTNIYYKQVNILSPISKILIVPLCDTTQKTQSSSSSPSSSSSSTLGATTSVLSMFWPSQHIISNFYDPRCS